MSAQKINLVFFLFIMLLSVSGHSLSYHPEVEIKDTVTSFSIQFIQSISNQKDIEGEGSIGDKIIGWIFGEEEISLVRPMSVCTVKDIVYVLDQGGGYVVKIDTAEGEFNLMLNEDDELFPSLLSTTVFRNGDLLFTDSKDNRIYKFNTNDDVIRPFSLNHDLDQPTGIAFHKARNEIWIVETKRHSIAVFNEKGEYLRSMGKRGTNVGEFNFPTYICIDDNGMVYIVDSGNFRIQIMNSEGEVQNVFGEAGDATGYFARPKGIAVDSYGHIYLVDGLYNSIQIFDFEGNFLYYFGTKGAGNGELWLPTGIYIDDNDFIYIADSYNSRIQIYRLTINETK